MLGRDEQMQPGFVDFQNFAHRVLVLLVGRLFFRPGSFIKKVRWDFVRAVQGWISYTGTHVPILVPKLGLIKPGHTSVLNYELLA